MRASCSPPIGPRRTIIGPRDYWEVYICGEEMLGTSLLAPACSGSKRSDSATKERAQGAPYAKKKKTQGAQ